MNPNTSRRLCLRVDDHVSLNDGFESEGQSDGSEFQDTTYSGKKKETKAFTFYFMETEEVSERYISPCFVSGLHAYDGEINLEYEKNMISNEFTIKLLLDYKKKMGKSCEKGVIITIYPDPISSNDDFDDDWEAILASVVSDLPQLDMTDVPTKRSSKNDAPKITMLDHSKAEPIGILKDVLYQVGVTIILAKNLILDIHVDRDVPIVVMRSFLYTCGNILSTIKRTTSIFDGFCHQKFYVSKVRNNHGESDSDDEEEYYLKRDEVENLSMDQTVQSDGDGKWHAKVRIIDSYRNKFDQGYETKATK
nr:hypothetical protein [Tanacetum cinerariifolium]